MSKSRGFVRQFFCGTIGFVLASAFGAHAEIKVLNTVKAKTAEVGYNASVMRKNSNAYDWLRYSGIKNLRVFMSPESIEPEENDDIPGTGDGVISKDKFIEFQTKARANASNRNQSLKNDWVNWPYFETNIKAAGENYKYGEAFPTFNSMGIDIMVTLQAFRSRFELDVKPLDQYTPEDYGFMWELWQHYYAVSFQLARFYNVHRYSIYNEPDHTNTVRSPDIELRLRITADAIRAGIADANRRYSKSLVAQIFAPNTGGPDYYFDTGDPEEPNTDYGHQIIINRKKNIWGVVEPTRRNPDIYTFQKYTLLQYSNEDFSGFVNTCQDVKAGMTADMGTDPILPVAFTEMNARTGAGYAVQEETADTPKDFTAVGATAVALTNDCPTGFQYLFKFAMMRGDSGWKSMLQKNGTHYVNIDEAPEDGPEPLNMYGGASGTGEVWRLFTKGAGSVRNSYNLQNDQVEEGVWTMVTRNASSPTATYIYIANRNLVPTSPRVFNFSSLSISSGSVATIEEVSANSRGGVVAVKSIASNKLDAGVMPPESVWLISIYHGRTVGNKRTNVATDATQLQDGASAGTVISPVPATLVARADGTLDNRKAMLLKFNKPSSLSGARILLELNVAQVPDAGDPAPTEPTQAHVYGISYDGWKATTSTFNNLTTLFKQNAANRPAGLMIGNNVVIGHNATAKIQGQIVADSTTPTVKYIDVTDFVKAQTDSTVSFLILQEHRWDYHPGAEKIPLPNNKYEDSLPTGDAQGAGIGISGRAVSATIPKLLTY